MKNNKHTEQKQKPYSDKKKYKDRDKVKKIKIKKEIVDGDALLKIVSIKLKSSGIFLLEIKTAVLDKSGNYIYAIIHKIPSVSHEDCVNTTKTIQAVLEDLSFNPDDYGITVSSAGFSWVFKSDIEYEIFLNNNIKIKYVDNEKNNTVEVILKDNAEDYIVIENKDKTEKKVLKKDIIKIRLNN